MSITESDQLAELWERRICPFCMGNVREDHRIGSGKITDGAFCSLRCYAEYYKRKLSDQAKKFLDASVRLNG